MPPAAGNIIQATLSGLYDGQTIETVWHMREWIEDQVDAAINLSLEVLRLLISPRLDPTFVWNQTQWKRMTPVALDTQFTPLTGSLTGTGSGGPCNSMLACVMTLRTGVAGKSHRGRKYVGGLAMENVGSDRLNNLGVTSFNTIAAALITNFGPSGTDPTLGLGIYSRLIGGSHPFTIAGWQQVQQVVPHSILGSQRRRRVGVGI